MKVFVPEDVKMDQIALSVRVGEEQLRTPLVRLKGGEAPRPQFLEKGLINVFRCFQTQLVPARSQMNLPAASSPSGS